MNRYTWQYQCQEDDMDESDEEKERWINPEEVQGEDSDEEEEMDEM